MKGREPRRGCLAFAPEMVEAILEGRKSVTRRLLTPTEARYWTEAFPPQGFAIPNREEPCRWDAGAVGVEASVGSQRARRTPIKHGTGPGQVFAMLLIREVRLVRLKSALRPGEARREGFAYLEGFRRLWCALHGMWEPEALVWRIEFKVVADFRGSP